MNTSQDPPPRGNLRTRIRHRRDRELEAYLPVLLADPCAYCGGPSELIDHIEPRSRGGRDAWENFAGICDACNGSKGSKSVLGMLASRLLKPEQLRLEAALAEIRALGMVGNRRKARA